MILHHRGEGEGQSISVGQNLVDPNVTQIEKVENLELGPVR